MVQNVITKFLPLVLATFISVSAFVSAGHSRSRGAHKGLAKRIGGDLGILDDLDSLFTNARWTFYDAGLGACGEINDDSDFIVALNAIQFGLGYPGPQCFKTITMEYNGKKATATIMDMCPECPYGALDLSRSLFQFFAPEDIGIIYGQWYFGSYDSDDNSDDTPDPLPHHKGDDRPPPPALPPTIPKPKLQVSAPKKPTPKPLKLKPVPKPPQPQQPVPRPLSNKNADHPPSANTHPVTSPPPILKTATSKVINDSPFQSEMGSYGSEDHPENLAALNMIFGRLGSIAAAGRHAQADSHGQDSKPH